jgi:3-isopropylmalate/(R)-2-methylmalate dehydratase small subunit
VGDRDAGQLDELPVLTARAWVFADRLQAAEIVPLELRDLGEQARRLFGPLDPGFSGEVRRGDAIVAGSEFACGVGGEVVARVLRRAGIAAVIARSFAPSFAAEALAVGLPAIVVDETLMVRTGDVLRIDIEGRRIVNLSSGDRYPIRELSEETVLALRAGGARVLAARRRLR